jgi:hypothetical protein
MFRVWGALRFVQGFGGVAWGKTPLESQRREWDCNIKIDVHEFEGVVETGWSCSG